MSSDSLRVNRWHKAIKVCNVWQEIRHLSEESNLASNGFLALCYLKLLHTTRNHCFKVGCHQWLKINLFANLRFQTRLHMRFNQSDSFSLQLDGWHRTPPIQPICMINSLEKLYQLLSEFPQKTIFVNYTNKLLIWWTNQGKSDAGIKLKLEAHISELDTASFQSITMSFGFGEHQKLRFLYAKWTWYALTWTPLE